MALDEKSKLVGTLTWTTMDDDVVWAFRVFFFKAHFFEVDLMNIIMEAPKGPKKKSPNYSYVIIFINVTKFFEK